MDSIHFRIPKSHQSNGTKVDSAYMVGIDGVAWPTRVHLKDDLLQVSRHSRESGRLVILWELEGHGTQALSTATIAPSEQTYLLPLELARGTLARLHARLHAVEGKGFTLDEEHRESLAAATRHFIQASLAQKDPERASSEANASLTLVLKLIATLGGHQQLAAGGDDEGAHSTVWGATIDKTEDVQVLSSISGSVPNVVLLQKNWCDLELNPKEWDWSALDNMVDAVDSDHFRVGFGPLVTLNREHLPDWLYLWEGDFDTICSYVSSYVQQLVSRYAGRFRFWLGCSGMNVDAGLGLSEGDRLKLTVSVLETIRQADPKTPLLLAVKQPWGEYLGRSSHDLTPLQFADIFVRGELGLSAIGLQIDLGYSLKNSLPRDLFEVNQMIDTWSRLGLPLVILLSAHQDAMGTLEEDHEVEFIESLLRFFGRKSAVHGVIWDPLVHHDDLTTMGLRGREGAETPASRCLRRAASQLVQ